MTSILLTALGWLAITIVCTGFVFACGQLLWWRHVASPGVLLGALALVMFGISALHLASSPLAGWRLAGKLPFDASMPVRVLFFLCFCLFPDGRLVWREARWLLIFYAFGILGVPDPFLLSTRTAGAVPAWSDALHELAVAAVLVRQLAAYRDLSTIGQHLRAAWAPAAFSAGAVALVISAWLSRVTNPSLALAVVRTAWDLAVSLAPVALGLALLRARLFDRAALLRRAVIYGLLTASLALAYFASIYELRAPFDALAVKNVGAPLGIANFLAVLAVALLFQPLRQVVQTAIDRRFYRRLAETARSFAAFSATAHEEIHVDSLGRQVLALLQATLPQWLAGPSDRRETGGPARWQAGPGASDQLPGTPPADGPAQCAVSLWVRLHLAEDVAALLPTDRRGWDGPPATTQRAMELYRWAPASGAAAERADLTIRPDDPLLPALLRAPRPVALERWPDSPAACSLRAAGMGSVMPLRDRGDVVGLIGLGAWPCWFDLRELLAALGAALAPPLRVAQRIHEQETQTRQRERVEQELQLAQRIQRSFLPHAVPSLAGWQITPYYQPAREVGGDFYDFLVLADGRLGLIVGDVTGKGVPAALLMAATRSMLRAAGQHAGSPGAVLTQVNDLLRPDMPPGMFVTCFYAILDPTTGRLRYANAGHELPYHRHGAAVTELYATGMPLGLMPARRYEEGEAVLQPGDSMLLYSDGLVEAHDRRRAMFGHARLARLVGDPAGDAAPIERVLGDLAAFTAPDWEQEDDVTLVLLRRSPAGARDAPHGGAAGDGSRARVPTDGDENVRVPAAAGEGSRIPAAAGEGSRIPAAAGEGSRVVDAWSLPSVPGNERLAMQRVRRAAQNVPLGEERLDQLETAVAEATLNAMEHGNGFQAERMVEFQVLLSPVALTVRIGDQGSGPLDVPAVAPDLAAKLAGAQSPRGWGLFLIRHLVDDVTTSDALTRHTIELRMMLPEGGTRGVAPAQPPDAASSAQAPDATQEPSLTSAPVPAPEPSLAQDSTASQDAAMMGLLNLTGERSTPVQQPDVTLTVRRIDPATACIDVQGDITGAAEGALMGAYAQASTPTTRSIILNFSGLAYMNSLGIGLLVTLLIRMQRQGQALLAYGLSDHYRRIFQLTRLDEAIVLAATEAEAVDAAARSA